MMVLFSKTTISFFKSYKSFPGWPKVINVPKNYNDSEATLKNDFDPQKDLPKLKQWKFEKVYKVIKGEYHENIKHLPHPDVFPDPWLSPANPATRWLYLISYRYGIEAAKSFIKANPHMTRYRKEKLKMLDRHCPINNSTNIEAAIDSNNIERAYELALNSKPCLKNIDHHLLHSLVEAVAADERSDLIKASKNFKNLPSFQKFIDLFDSTKDIPTEFYETYFFGLMKKIYLSESIESLSYLSDIAAYLIESKKRLSPHFYYILYKLNKNLFSPSTFSKIMENMCLDNSNHSFIYSKDVFNCLVQFIPSDRVIKHYLIFSKIHNNDGLGMIVYNRILSVLLTKEIEAIQFFCLSFDYLSKEDLLDYNFGDIFRYFQRGVNLLISNNLPNTLIYCLSKMNDIKVFSFLDYGSYTNIMNEVFMYFRSFGKTEHFIKFIEIMSQCQNQDKHYITSIMEHTISLKDPKITYKVINCFIKTNICLPKQFFCELMLTYLVKSLRTSKINVRDADDILNLSQGLRLLGEIKECKDTEFIEIYCAIAQKKLLPLQHLLSKNSHIMNFELLEGALNSSFIYDGRYVTEVLFVMRKFISESIVDEIFDHSCLVCKVPIKTRIKILESYRAKMKEMTKK